jgi:hypothetical protein
MTGAQLGPKMLMLAFRDRGDVPDTVADGLKLVLFEVSQDGRFKGYDWGFATWTKTENWEDMDNEEGFRARVVRWADMPKPQNLLS